MVVFDDAHENHIRMGPVQQFENEELRPDPLLDMSILCEAVSAMIKVCDNGGIKKESDSLRYCIKHLTDAFADPSFKV